MGNVSVSEITVKLTREEAYALCNKLTDDALVTHGGYCEFDQIRLLQRVGRELGSIVEHSAAKNDLTLDVVQAVRDASAKRRRRPTAKDTARAARRAERDRQTDTSGGAEASKQRPGTDVFVKVALSTLTQRMMEALLRAYRDEIRHYEEDTDAQ